jgi:hypothetical protein
MPGITVARSTLHRLLSFQDQLEALPDDNSSVSKNVLKARAAAQLRSTGLTAAMCSEFCKQGDEAL